MSDRDCLDITEVLVALRLLAEKASHPVVRVCLEQAHEDIAHLTRWDDLPEPVDGETATE